MKSGLNNPTRLVYTPVSTTITCTIPLGTAGYVDTDCSATMGTDSRKIWIVNCSCVSAQLLGVRALGETNDPKMTTTSCVQLTHVDNTGHAEFYRNATNDATYKVIGYIL